MTQDKAKAKLNSQIDANLKRVYQETIDQEVPDRFKQLLDQLKTKEPKS